MSAWGKGMSGYAVYRFLPYGCYIHRYFNLEKDRNSWDVILYKNKAKEILNILIKCGVHSHEEKEFIWSNEYSKKYNKLSQVQSGQECMVVAPYWIYNGDIFEKGLVKEM